jgi:hypothetical protein
MPAEPIATPSRSARSGDGWGWWRNGVIHQMVLRRFRDPAAVGVDAPSGDTAGSTRADWYRLEVDE